MHIYDVLVRNLGVMKGEGVVIDIDTHVKVVIEQVESESFVG